MWGLPPTPRRAAGSQVSAGSGCLQTLREDTATPPSPSLPSGGGVLAAAQGKASGEPAGLAGLTSSGGARS